MSGIIWGLVNLALSYLVFDWLLKTKKVASWYGICIGALVYLGFTIAGCYLFLRGLVEVV